MKETKFTKGDWVIDHGAKVYCDTDGEVICKCDEHFMVDKGKVESLANAHLIKTAPKLYDVLNEICNLADNDDQTIADEMVRYFDKIELLLAEARGE